MARILIVDDEEMIRDLLKEVLSAQGHEFHLAAHSMEALDILRKNAVDLAIVDRNMPGMSGIELIRLIRQNPKMAKVKILMCTGTSLVKEVDEAFAAGADGYITKPPDFAMVLGKVAKTLAAPPKA